MHVKIGYAGVLAAALVVTPALAQTTSPPAAGSKQVIPEKKGDALETGRSESLSKKLDKSDGVIKPNANIDPGMHAPTPKTAPHTMPVIPPSATGGDTAK